MTQVGSDETIEISSPDLHERNDHDRFVLGDFGSEFDLGNLDDLVPQEPGIAEDEPWSNARRFGQ